MIQVVTGYLALSYRYQRGSRSLLDNLGGGSGAIAGGQGGVTLEDEDEEEYDVPEEIEEVIGEQGRSIM